MLDVSVIVPFFNANKYIEKCVVSLFEQTNSVDIEYIFVNDGSNDESVQIVKDKLNEYNQLKSNVHIIDKEHSGQIDSRHVGLNNSTGKYVIFCDADDWVHTSMYNTLHTVAKENECLDIVWCDILRTNGSENLLLCQKTEVSRIDVFKQMLLGNKLGSLCNHLIKRELILDKRIIWPNKNMMEDFVVLFQCFYYARSWGYVNKPFYYYFNNPLSSSNISVQSRIIQQEMEMRENLKLLLGFIELNKLNASLYDEIVYRKFFNKRWLLPAISHAKDCKLWIQCFSEINLALYFNKYISSYEKIISILVSFRLYPFLRHIIRHH